MRGDSTTFYCSAIGNGTLTIMWRTPFNTVDTGQRMLSVWSVSSNITVSNITAAEGGNYTCIAGNEAGFSEASATLFVSVYVVSNQTDLSNTSGSVESVC